jgi:hypothetical protein
MKEKAGTYEKNYNGGTDVYGINSYGRKEKVVTVKKSIWDF